MVNAFQLVQLVFYTQNPLKNASDRRQFNQSHEISPNNGSQIENDLDHTILPCNRENSFFFMRIIQRENIRMRFIQFVFFTYTGFITAYTHIMDAI